MSLDPVDRLYWLAVLGRIARPVLTCGAAGELRCNLCAAGLLPLGLPPAHPFWRDPAQPWTAQCIWQGEDVPCDHHLVT